jgi:hypothetical protein
VERLSDEADDALGHLQLILEWWSEFTSNHGDMTSWLDGMEERVAALEDQLSSAVSPRPCPLTLQQTAKVILQQTACNIETLKTWDGLDTRLPKLEWQ